MKYIRTKEFVYELISDINNKGYNVKVKTPFSYALVSKASIIGKPVDTIEELIDCYSYETETTKDLGVALGWKFANQSRHIYGCIKTNIGLIYVCEMNSDGNLRLFSDQTK